MPRGMHPNSRKALEENRKATQFKPGESAVTAADKSNAKQAQKRTFKEEFEIELSAKIRDSKGNETTVKNAISKKMIQKALNGDQRAAEFIRDCIGEKPKETVEVVKADYSALDGLSISDDKA